MKDPVSEEVLLLVFMSDSSLYCLLLIVFDLRLYSDFGVLCQMLNF